MLQAKRLSGANNQQKVNAHAGAFACLAGTRFMPATEGQPGDADLEAKRQRFSRTDI